MKYLKIIILCFVLASIGSLASVFAMQSTDLFGESDTDFKNLPYGIAIGINICFFLASLTILMNLKQGVRDNTIYNALSFFLLPGLLVLFLLLAMWDEPWPGVLFCMPYLVMLFVLFSVQKNRW